MAEAASAQGRDVFILGFENQADPESLQPFPHAFVRLGAAARGIELLRDAGVTDVVMAGPIRRPTLRELAPDWRTAKFLAKVGLAALGDDGLLRAVVRELEEEGFRILGIDDILPDILAPLGPLGRHKPDSELEADIERGLVVARVLGAADVGQSVIVQQGIVLGVEAAEGTDGLIRRSMELARSGPGGVLVKIKKPGQERRADLPTVGPATVDACIAAGLSGIAVEAGATLIVDRARAIARADAAGLFLIGVSVS